MSSADRNSALGRQIAAILSSSQRVASPGERHHSLTTRCLVCSSVAMLALSPTAGFAVGIGEVKLNSRLGQPLRATVPVRLGSGEALTAGCVKSTDPANADLRAPRDVDVRTPAASGPGVYDLELSTALPLYEPMYELSLRVDCGGMPELVKHYVLMLDLPVTPATPVARPSQPGNLPAAQPRPPAAMPAPATAPRERVQRSREPIAPGKTYRVRAGDTLSTIAARIDGRPANFIWPMADLIFAANPDAFIRGNPDLIKLGAEIRIPAPSEWQTEAASMAAEPPPPAPATTRVTTAAPPAPAPASLPTLPATEPPSMPAAAEPAPATLPAPSVPTVVDRPAAIDSPFIDEQPAPPAEIAAPVPVAPPPVTVEADSPTPPIVITESRPTRTVSPLLAILFGVLLGFGLSMLLLRGRLIEGLLGLLPGRRSAAQPTREGQTFDDTSDWLPHTDTEIGLAPINPADDTYVVEIDADESAETFDPVISPPAEPPQEPATATAKDVAAVAAAAATDDDVMLAELFDEDLAGLPAEPDLPEEVFMAEPDLDQTNAMAPTEEMPHFNDSTASMDVVGSAIDETEELAELGDDAEETASLTLDKLSELSAEDTRLSETLRDALSLLERDYEDELTASQVIDQEALKRAIGDSNEDTGTQTQPKLRKQTG